MSHLKAKKQSNSNQKKIKKTIIKKQKNLITEKKVKKSSMYPLTSLFILKRVISMIITLLMKLSEKVLMDRSSKSHIKPPLL